MLVCIEPPKLAVTLLGALTVTLQAVVPVQAPDHPANVFVVTGVAASVTCVPGAKFAEQIVDVDEQLMPEGLLVTVPEPAPAKATVNAMPPTLNMAFTVSAAARVTEQAPAPVQLPLHPLK